MPAGTQSIGLRCACFGKEGRGCCSHHWRVPGKLALGNITIDLELSGEFCRLTCRAQAVLELCFAYRRPSTRLVRMEIDGTGLCSWAIYLSKRSRLVLLWLSRSQATQPNANALPAVQAVQARLAGPEAGPRSQKFRPYSRYPFTTSFCLCRVASPPQNQKKMDPLTCDLCATLNLP